MCPDKQFLSIYYDGELPQTWEKKMETHLETCPECRSHLDSYQKASGVLNGLAATDDDGNYTAIMEAAKDRVWQRLNSENIVHKFVRPGFPSHIPTIFTAAVAGAAAAAAIIFMTLLITPKQNDAAGLTAGNAPADGFRNVAVSNDYELDIPEIVPASNMQELLRYLEDDDSSNIVIIKLPERKKFNRYGEPALINAADYTRGRPQN